jgi:hypothetical protein
MDNFNLGYLRKDLGFIEQAIQVSNVSKKKTFEVREQEKVPKKIKNLRYFLKKKRNITYKHSPS